jgi:hypothetical protein
MSIDGAEITRSIVSTLGYNQTNSLLLTAPPYILAAALFYISSYVSDVSA